MQHAYNDEFLSLIDRNLATLHLYYSPYKLYTYDQWLSVSTGQTNGPDSLTGNMPTGDYVKSCAKNMQQDIINLQL